MQRERLTPERIRRFTCPKDVKQSFLWDTESPRLAVRATAGAKSFIFESKINRKTVRVTIGDVKAWPLSSVWDGSGEDRREIQRGAREEANRLQSMVNQGIDPRQEKADRASEMASRKAAEENAKIEAARLEAPALEAWEAYIEARRPRWSPRHLFDHQQMATEGGEPRTRGRRKGAPETTVSGILRPLLLQPLVQIDASTVRGWLKDESAKRPTRARLAFALLRAFLNWCSDRQEYASQIHPDACAGRLARDELPKTSARDDCLQREQLKPWFAAVRSLPSVVVSAYLQVVLLTGARREEVAGMRWDDVDFQWKSLTIRDKVEGLRTIPLTPYVDALLQDLKRRNDTPPPAYRILRGKKIKNDLTAWAPSPWVFSSPTAASGRLQDARAAHVRAIEVAGLPTLSLHGLRRSFGTLSEWVECPVGVVAQIQGHKPSAIAEKHYRRRPLDLLRMWHTKIEAWILAEAGIEPPQSAAAPLQLVATPNA